MLFSNSTIDTFICGTYSVNIYLHIFKTESDISLWHEANSKFKKIEYHSYTSYTTSFNNNEEIRTYINLANGSLSVATR